MQANNNTNTNIFLLLVNKLLLLLVSIFARIEYFFKALSDFDYKNLSEDMSNPLYDLVSGKLGFEPLMPFAFLVIYLIYFRCNSTSKPKNRVDNVYILKIALVGITTNLILIAIGARSKQYDSEAEFVVGLTFLIVLLTCAYVVARDTREFLLINTGRIMCFIFIINFLYYAAELIPRLENGDPNWYGTVSPVRKFYGMKLSDFIKVSYFATCFVNPAKYNLTNVTNHTAHAFHDLGFATSVSSWQDVHSCRVLTTNNFVDCMKSKTEFHYKRISEVPLSYYLTAKFNRNSYSLQDYYNWETAVVKLEPDGFWTCYPGAEQYDFIFAWSKKQNQILQMAWRIFKQYGKEGHELFSNRILYAYYNSAPLSYMVLLIFTTYFGMFMTRVRKEQRKRVVFQTTKPGCCRVRGGGNFKKDKFMNQGNGGNSKVPRTPQPHKKNQGAREQAREHAEDDVESEHDIREKAKLNFVQLEVLNTERVWNTGDPCATLEFDEVDQMAAPFCGLSAVQLLMNKEQKFEFYYDMWVARRANPLDGPENTVGDSLFLSDWVNSKGFNFSIVDHTFTPIHMAVHRPDVPWVVIKYTQLAGPYGHYTCIVPKQSTDSKIPQPMVDSLIYLEPFRKEEDMKLLEDTELIGYCWFWSKSVWVTACMCCSYLTRFGCFLLLLRFFVGETLLT